MSAWVFMMACSAHPRRDVSPGAVLESAETTGGVEIAYRLEWDGRAVGRERISVDRREGLVRWIGRVTQIEPLETGLRWEVWLDPRGAEPVGFEVRVELAGETLRTQGWREGADFRFERRAFGDVETGAIGYGGGTAVDLASPLSWWWAASLLKQRLAPGEATDVRLVVVRPPALAPEVRTVEISRAVEGDGSVEIEGPGDETTAVRVAADGWPERVVTDRPRWGRSLIRRRVPVEAAGR
jgi:hypothetical protein